MRRAILFAVVLMYPSVAWTAGYSSMGVGTVTCERFLGMYASDPAMSERVFFSWAQGFMSGMNQILLTQGGRTKNLQSMTLDEEKAWLRAWCRQNPSAAYQSAVTKLWIMFENNPAVPRPRQ